MKEQKDTPRIFLDKKNGVFEISGRSLPEDVEDFYNPVLKWLEFYKKEPNATTAFVFKLEYANTASSKLIQDILSSLEKIGGVTISWHSLEDDEDMQDMGQELSELVEMPFEFKTY